MLNKYGILNMQLNIQLKML